MSSPNRTDTTHADATGDRRPPRVRVLLDRVLSASAGLVALTALAVSVYQAWISREQQKLSAWPYVMQANTGVDGYGWLVQNVGLGPALVRSMRVEVDRRPVHSWTELLLAVDRIDTTAFKARFPRASMTTSDVRRGTVLLPGVTIQMLQVDSGTFARAMRTAINDERVSIRICYCSLYGDCWLNDNSADEPTPVKQCPDDRAREFR